MPELADSFLRSMAGYARYFAREVTTPHPTNYFYWLVAVSLAVYALELVRPWRVEQPRLRKGFFLDAWYLFFNFFGFQLLGFAAVAATVDKLLSRGLAQLGFSSWVLVDLSLLPGWVQLIIAFVARDFVQWNIHRLLHRIAPLWELHKVHHSVEQMGFAAHMRFHWMETVLYRSLEYIPLALLGFSIKQFFIVHLVALCIGHLNHANFELPIGPLKRLFNSPQMHIWHHARHLPARYGVNFGISLSLWDYLFATAYVPKDGRDEPLGFENIEHFPSTFLRQAVYPLGRRRDS